MSREMCPSCKREVLVFKPRDIEGGFFYKHNNAKGVECRWSLRAYPRPIMLVPDNGQAAVVKDNLEKIKPPNKSVRRTAGL